MRRLAAAAVVCSALLVAPSGSGASGSWDSLLAPESACPGQSDASLSASQRARAMVCLHRYARASQGLPALRVSRKLKASSAHKARDIERCQEFSHEACGHGPFYWFKRVGFLRHSSDAAENLALGNGTTATARGAMSDWLNSDDHRAVLLAPGLDEFGVSVVSGRFQGYSGVSIWVAHFGSQR